MRRRVQQMQRLIFGEPTSPLGPDAAAGAGGSFSRSASMSSDEAALRRSGSTGSFSALRGASAAAAAGGDSRGRAGSGGNSFSGGSFSGGSADKAWADEEASERAVLLLSETLQAADVMPQLLAQLKAVDFETRKSVASVFCHLVRNNTGCFASEYLRFRPHVVYQVRRWLRSEVMHARATATRGARVSSPAGELLTP